MHWKRFFIPLIFIAGIGTYFYFLQAPEYTPARYALVKFERVTVRAEIADTTPARVQGLSGRERLGATDGMLFVLIPPPYNNFG